MRISDFYNDFVSEEACCKFLQARGLIPSGDTATLHWWGATSLLERRIYEEWWRSINKDDPFEAALRNWLDNDSALEASGTALDRQPSGSEGKTDFGFTGRIGLSLRTTKSLHIRKIHSVTHLNLKSDRTPKHNFWLLLYGRLCFQVT